MRERLISLWSNVRWCWRLAYGGLAIGLALANGPAAPLARATTSAAMAPAAGPVAITPAPMARAASLAGGMCGDGGVELLGFSDELNGSIFNGSQVGGLSGLTYDAARDHYYAVVDNERETPARVFTLRIPWQGDRLGRPSVVAMTRLSDAAGQAYTGRTFDGEGIVWLVSNELIITSETEPSLRRFGLDGRQRGSLPVPGRFRVSPAGQGRGNQTFESLTLSPDGQRLVTAVEGSLTADGMDERGRQRLRLLRYTIDTAGEFRLTSQHFYLTESAFGVGVADLAALSDQELLVLERGFTPLLGNSIRLFRVDLDGAADISGVAGLTATDLPLAKRLVVDLATCPAEGATHPARQPTPLLDNFEGMALGPRLADGRQTVLLISDNNFGTDQVTRLVALALPPTPVALPPTPVALPPTPVALPPTPVAVPPTPVAVPPTPMALPRVGAGGTASGDLTSDR